MAASGHRRLDALAAALACGVSFAVYYYTAAPCITMQDAGEEVTAAQLFGVPHPPGYPLWTFLSWVFHLMLPQSNAAWKVNLFTGVCGALAVGCAAWLISNSLRWLFTPEDAEPDRRTTATSFVIAVSFGLALAFSVSVWSQSVFAEVHILHALVVSLYMTALYRWVKNPSRLGGLVLVVFLFALGMTAHHLMLSLAVLPLFAVALLRRDFLAEFLVFMAFATGIVYLGFARLSGDMASWNTAARFLWCAVGGFIVLIWIKRRELHWRISLCFLLVPLGLVPYIYLPIASSTNPPMNWGYTRIAPGFFSTINRSQYQGPLSVQLLGTLGKVMGSEPPKIPWEQQQQNPSMPQDQPSRLKNLMAFAGHYWVELYLSFSIVPILGFLFAVPPMFGRERNKRAWMFLLFFAFFLAAFLQPFFDQPGIDLAGWDLQMPYHGYAYLIFAVLSASGFGFLLLVIQRKFRLSHRWTYALFLLPIYGLLHNRADCTQRDHWFGWQYGHDMLKDLPKDAIVFGGTDPGRFIPTYMIFGESSQPPAAKRDPNFDRRDLYIITQNTLGDPFYLMYLRDQYTSKRPKQYGPFEKWLGRESIYPKGTITMPEDSDMREIVKKIIEAHQGSDQLPTDVGTAINTDTARWIFERNKDKHAFFVEESFPLEWSYPYATPAGLVYRINPEPLDKIPQEDIDKDQAFWKKYTSDLLANPRYDEDVNAKHSFSKLRTTMGNIYSYRGLENEAETAYRQSLELWPANPESISGLLRIFTNQRRFDEGIALMQASFPLDPHSVAMQQLTAAAFLRRDLQGDMDAAEHTLHADPKNRDAILKLLQDDDSIGDNDAAEGLITHTLEVLPDDTVVLQNFINHYVEMRRFDKALTLARRWDRLDPDNPEVKFMLTKFFFATGAREEFYENAMKAVELGGLEMRERYAREPVFGMIRGEPAFQALVKTNAVPMVGRPATPNPNSTK